MHLPFTSSIIRLICWIKWALTKEMVFLFLMLSLTLWHLQCWRYISLTKWIFVYQLLRESYPEFFFSHASTMKNKKREVFIIKCWSLHRFFVKIAFNWSPHVAIFYYWESFFSCLSLHLQNISKWYPLLNEIKFLCRGKTFTILFKVETSHFVISKRI